MTEENTNVSESVASPPPKPVPSPKVVKEAEHKLKEMSRKAKERKTAHNASKNSKALSETNYFWLVIGGLGALGVGYLVFGKKEPEQKPRQRFKFVPKPKTPEKVPVKDSVSTRQRQLEARDEVVEKESVATPKFELNCF